MKVFLVTVWFTWVTATFMGVRVIESLPDYSPQLHPGVASHYNAGPGMVAACRLYAPGTHVRVTRGYRPVEVVITSKGPSLPRYREGRLIDLSPAAFERLCPLKQGLFLCNFQSIQP